MRWVVAALLLLWVSAHARAHEIYTGVYGKDQQLCCGGNDCAATVYREKGDHFEFLTRENHWIPVPQDRITFLPLPGDEDFSTINHAHLCYRFPNPGEVNSDHMMSGDGQTIYFYCAFIPPGGV